MGIFNSNIFIKETAKSDITRIIAITGLMYVILFFIRVSFLMNSVSDNFFTVQFWNTLCIPNSVTYFAKQSWCLFTYMFIHNDILAMISSMVWVWVFGTVYEDTEGKNSVLSLFILGSLLGGVFLLLSTFIFKNEALHLYFTPYAGITTLAVASILKNPSYVFMKLTFMQISISMFGILYVILLVSMNTTNIHLWSIIAGGAFMGVLSRTILKSFFKTIQNKLTTGGDYFWNNKNYIK
jgi:membrane associated rhomboid family serine protease